MIETTTYSPQVLRNYDPTHTTMLRNAFAADMKRRFNELIKVIKVSVVDNDCFGLKKKHIITQQMQAASPNAFAFPTNTQKVSAFMKWLQQQVEAGIITTTELEQIGASVHGEWTNLYIYDSYKRGVIRARQELKARGYNVPTIAESGGIGAVLGTPFHIERVGMLYIRTYNELRGITSAMDNIISKVLAQGMVDGDGPALLARKLVAGINGSGAGDLGLTDTIGRFIPPQRRATILARTETIRAHHMGNMAEYKEWRVFGLEIQAEWRTAGDNRVCSKCDPLEGHTFTLEQAETMIPLHPLCRCIALPVIVEK